MLKELHIQNFVLIEDLALGFENGICLLTGETGAGKSIMIDAVAAALGGRVSLDSIRAGARKASIEVKFAREKWPTDLQALLEAEGIEPAVAGELTLARELSPRGSRCRIDGQQVTQAVLRRAGQSLVDILSQHEHQALLDAGFHLELLDQFGKLAAQREAVARAHAAWQDLKHKHQALLDGARERARQEDFWRFQLDEIEEARITAADEDEQLKAERLKLANVEQLRQTTAGAYDKLYGGERSLCDQVGRVTAMLNGQSQLDPTFGEIAAQVDEAQTLLREAATALRGHLGKLDADPERLEQVEERLDLLNGLGRKYGPGLDKVLKRGKWLAQELAALESAGEQAEALEGAIAAAELALAAACEALSAARREAAGALEAAVERQLRDLELPNARFHATLRPVEGWRATGRETCEFEIAMNPGEPPRSLARTASGGEMARVMLSLKTVLAGLGEIPTLIFDEVDTGISGKAAQAVAEKLAGLGRHYQILCITHLPTVAAMADQHLHLEKHVAEGRTHVQASVLDAGARVRELALLASGSPAPKALQHAEELLGRAQAFKTALVPRTRRGALARRR